MRMNQQSGTNQLAEMYWDFMDVNANLERAEWIARQVPNGLHSLVNFIATLIAFIASLVLAWHFDFHSTYEALSGLRTHIVPGLPASLAAFTAIITAVITVAPTVMEIFTSNLARANILVIKVFVLGFTVFDVITDIPTTRVWIDTWQPSFDALGPLLSPIVYWIVFFGWLAMATVGFQISVAIFGYLLVIYARKAFFGMTPPSRSAHAYQQAVKGMKQQQGGGQRASASASANEPKVERVVVEASAVSKE